MVVLHQEHVNAVFHACDVSNQPETMTQQFFELTDLEAAHVDGADQPCSQKLCQHMRVHLVILDLGRSNGLGFERIRDDHVKTVSMKQVIEPVLGGHRFNDDRSRHVKSLKVA